MTNELTNWLGAAGAAVSQMQQQPLAVLLIPVLIVFGAMLKTIPRFPNRMIPTFVILAGGCVNAAFGSVSNPGALDPAANLTFVQFLHGFLIGTGAWVLHAVVLKRFERFVPFLAGKSGDTVEIKKSDVEEK